MINVKNRIETPVWFKVRKQLCDKVNCYIFYKLTMKVYAGITNQLKMPPLNEIKRRSLIKK
jgi:hypothetical protein